MELGIFAKTFKRNTLDDVLNAVVEGGFSTVQFNMACAGLESMPAQIENQIVERIRQSLNDHRLHVCALSATFNMIHPDPGQRKQDLQRFAILAERARSLGTDLLTLCTGTRDHTSQWKHHPDNATPEAWADLIDTLLKCIAIADEHDLRLGIEPEINNVIDSPQKARQLLDEMQCPRLVIIMDPANIFRYPDLPKMDVMLVKSFELLEPYIALAHGKDVSNEDPPTFCAAGTGVLNYALYMKLLRQMDYRGPLILHGLSEEQVPASANYVKSFMNDDR
jgi:sugar phosphate isomerase/epimerase